eukprot:3163350-Rhodomonas_salina.1
MKSEGGRCRWGGAMGSPASRSEAVRIHALSHTSRGTHTPSRATQKCVFSHAEGEEAAQRGGKEIDSSVCEREDGSCVAHRLFISRSPKRREFDERTHLQLSKPVMGGAGLEGWFRGRARVEERARIEE